MLAAHVVTRSNLSLYEREFDQYLRARHDIYVREKNWRPARPDGREIDQFDTDTTTYFLGFEDGELVASARLVPADEPNLVSDVYPHMCEKEALPRRPDWADWTRMYVAPERRTPTRRGSLTQICAAVMEYCVEEGIIWAGGIQNLYFLPMWRVYGWRLRHMGMPQEVAGELAVVAYIRCDEEALASIRRVLGTDQSLLVRRGAQRPFIPQTVHA